MARRRYIFDENRVQAYIDAGRGKNSGPDYFRWLSVQDLPSLDGHTASFGITTSRVIHFPWETERKCFLKLGAVG